MKANDIQIILRQEQEADYKQTEFVTREAFWNYYTPKCYEHYLLHIMRNSFGVVKELDLLRLCCVATPIFILEWVL